MISRKPNNLESKVIIVGEPSVGKTSILTQFHTRSFSHDCESTVGASFISQPVETSRGTVSLFMWDTAGHERYRSLIPMYSRNAAAAILVVDITSQPSVDAMDVWLKMIKDDCPEKCKIYVAANKIDLESRVPVDVVEEWAKERGFPIFKMTATKYETVEPLFKKIAEDISRSGEEVLTRPSGALKLKDTKETHTNCC